MNQTNSRNLNFEYLTLVYNLVEAYLAILFGIMANSIGLIGFGIQSTVEFIYGIVLILGVNSNKFNEKDHGKSTKHKIKRFVVIIYIIFGAPLLFEALRRLLVANISQPTLAGVLIALASLMMTPLLTVLKYKTSKNQNESLTNDLQGTFYYMLLPFILLIGLALNFFTGVWQADSVVAIIVAVFMLKKGFDTQRDIIS